MLNYMLNYMLNLWLIPIKLHEQVYKALEMLTIYYKLEYLSKLK